MKLIIVLAICFISSIYGEKLHEYMTNDEIHSIFNVHRDNVHEVDYQVVSILHVDPKPNNTLHKRRIRSGEGSSSSSSQLHIKAFNQNYKLYLEENNNVLLGDKTPVFLAKANSHEKNSNSDEIDVVYSKFKYPFRDNFKLYHDVENRAAVSIHHENDEKFHVNGVVGDDIIIRSLPKRIHDEVLETFSIRSKRSSDSNRKAGFKHPLLTNTESVSENTSKATSHVIIKQNTSKNRPMIGCCRCTGKGADVKQSIITMRKLKLPSNLQNDKPDIVYPQLLITIDYDIFKVYNRDVEAVAKYMAAFWNAVDLRYRELNDPNVRLNIAGLIIPKNSNSAPYMEEHKLLPDTISDENTLHAIGKFFFLHLDQFTKDTYDIVVGITSKNLGCNDNGNVITTTSGLAAFAKACQVEKGHAVALIKDQGGFNGITTAAHEVAHLFGAMHDGEGSASSCPWEDGYLMSYKRVDQKGMHFSECSARDMREFFRLPQASCLYNKPNIGSPYPKVLPGRLLSRDEQCRRTLGEEWKASKSRENNCALLWCQSREKANEEGKIFITENHRPPAEGSYCGEGAICLNGECVKDPELS